MRKRTWTVFAAVTAVAAVGVTTAVAGSSSRDTTSEPASNPATTSTVGVTGQQTKEPAAAGYWTPQRMKDAVPAVRAVPGGGSKSTPATPTPRTAMEPSSPQATTKSPSSTGTTSKRKTATQAGQGEQSGVAGQDANDAASYWTPEQIDGATPMERTVPGGDGSSEGSSDPGVVPLSP